MRWVRSSDLKKERVEMILIRVRHVDPNPTQQHKVAGSEVCVDNPQELISHDLVRDHAELL